MSGLNLNVSIEHWPIAGSFTISRGSKSEATVIVTTIGDGECEGRGECVPYARYGETVAGVRDAIVAMEDLIKRGMTRGEISQHMPAGAARNGIDCALWDYEAKKSGKSVMELAGLKKLVPLDTAYTISLGAPDVMARQAVQASDYPLLKIKLGGQGDDERLRAVRSAVPQCRLIVDANESWHADNLERLLALSATAGVELIEQPIAAGQDEILEDIVHHVPICADESVHERLDLPRVAERYEAVNIKLDKAGGLTEALAMAGEARALGMRIMVGCMVSTSLAMAPALILAQQADWVDLDGPLLLAIDRQPGLAYEGTTILPADKAFWG